MLLHELPDQVLLSIYVSLSARDLARLESTASQFSVRRTHLRVGGARASLLECAAELAVAARDDAWRVALRAGESWKRVLFVLQRRLWAPARIATGDTHSLVASAGPLYSFGSDEQAQLGLGESDQCVSHWIEGAFHTVAKTTPHPVTWSATNSPAVCVAVGTMHSAAVSAPGQLRTWGGATDGQLGIGPVDIDDASVAAPRLLSAPPNEIRRLMDGFPSATAVSFVAAGDYHTACISATGIVFTWGTGGEGQLGHGTDTYHHDMPRRVSAVSKHRMVGVSCGSEMTAMVSADGDLFMCGMLPGEVYYGWCDHTQARLPFGEWYHEQGTEHDLCFDEYQLLAPQAQASFVLVTSLDQLQAEPEEYNSYLTGGGMCLARIPERTSVGGGGGGSLGDGDDDQGDTERAVSHVSCGGQHIAAVTVDGALYTWGSGGCFLGHGGLESSVVRPTKVMALSSQSIKLVSCGEQHTACVSRSGLLWCWGVGSNGQLGLGDVPGNGLNDGDESLPQRVLLGGLQGRASTVSCGGDVTLVAMEGGELYSFGCGLHGQLGLGDR